MTTIEYIKQRFSYIGEISDVGASDFAIDFDLGEGDITDEGKRIVGNSVDVFIEKNILHPASVNESDFSMSWSSDSIKTNIKLMLKKYGIDLNEEIASMIGLGVIKDVSDIW